MLPCSVIERDLVWRRVREVSSSFEAALKVKSEQLDFERGLHGQTEELLRSSREESSAMEAELKAKSAQLVQTTELLRTSREEVEQVRSRSERHEAERRGVDEQRRGEDEARGRGEDAVAEELRALKAKYVQLLETCESTLRALNPRWSAPQEQEQHSHFLAISYIFMQLPTFLPN